MEVRESRPDIGVVVVSSDCSVFLPLSLSVLHLRNVPGLVSVTHPKTGHRRTGFTSLVGRKKGNKESHIKSS